jgi:lysophospholipase L1-like esterase
MQAQHRPRVLLIGDSITQQSFSTEHCGFGAALSDWLCRTADVINRGFSGYNTRWMRWILPRLLPLEGQSEGGERTVLVTIFLGANDAVLPGETQHVPLDEYEENLEFLLSHVRRFAPTANIVLITPPTVDTELWPTRSPDAAAEYAAIVRSVARRREEQGLALLDLADLATRDLRDGLHLNASGNKKVFEKLQNLLREKFPEICPKVEADDAGHPLHFPPSHSFAGKSEEELKRLLTSDWGWG